MITDRIISSRKLSAIAKILRGSLMVLICAPRSPAVERQAQSVVPEEFAAAHSPKYPTRTVRSPAELRFETIA